MFIWYVMYSIFFIPFICLPFFGGLFFRPQVFRKLIFIPAVLELTVSVFLLFRFLPDYFSGFYQECIVDPTCMYEDPSIAFSIIGFIITLFLVIIALIVNKVSKSRFDPLNDPHAFDNLE